MALTCEPDQQPHQREIGAGKGSDSIAFGTANA